MLFCEGWFCIFMKGEHLLSLTEQDCGSGGLSGGDWTCPEWAGTVGTVTVPFPPGTCGNVWRYFLLSQLNRGGGCYRHRVAKVAVQYPTLDRRASHHKEFSSPKCP